jgi:hypothetical protein
MGLVIILKHGAVVLSWLAQNIGEIQAFHLPGLAFNFSVTPTHSKVVASLHLKEETDTNSP